MKKLLLVSLAAVSFNLPAVAENYSDYMQPYAMFKTNMADQDYKSAADSAYDAWQIAEKQLGDDPKTGILAQNYASLHYETDLNYKRVSDAYIRAMQLSATPEDRKRLLGGLSDYMASLNSNRLEDRIRRKLLKNVRMGLINTSDTTRQVRTAVATQTAPSRIAGTNRAR